MNIKPSSTLPKGGISKREFLRLSAAGLGGLLLSTRGLSGLVLGLGSSSCGPSLQDVRNVNKGIEDIVYECNPILPIPKRGCYTGTNEQSGVNMKSVASLGLRFKDTYGLPPALNAPGVGTWGCANDDFPKECEAFLSAGIIPMLRYVVSPYNFIRGGFKEIANGASDEYFKRFAAKAAEFGKAIVLVPWQCVNEPYWERQVWRWSRADPSEYKAAWVRMHDIFEQEGANKNVVWSTKLVAWGFDQSTPARDPFDYIPDKEHVAFLAGYATPISRVARLPSTVCFAVLTSKHPRSIQQNPRYSGSLARIMREVTRQDGSTQHCRALPNNTPASKGSCSM